MFILAVIMYVVDTDLLHWSPPPNTTDEEFTKETQVASNGYGTTSQATGTILKP